MSGTHPTPLFSHFKGKELWLDTAALVIVWLLSIILNRLLTNPTHFYIIKLVQITALMASIEYIGFFALHVFGKSRGLLIQGLLGGFISSTMIFIQIGSQEKTHHYSTQEIARSLILATLAMLSLGVVIIWTIAEYNQLTLSMPFLLQAFALTVSLFFFRQTGEKPKRPAASSLVILDDPIVWRNVVKFTFFLALILMGVKALTKLLPESYLVSTFVIALFESHAVLAAFITGIEDYAANPQIVVCLILLGNVVSKVFLTLKSPVKAIKLSVCLILLGSFLFSLLALLF